LLKKIVLIRIKPANQIKFIRKIKVSIKHYNIICWHADVIPCTTFAVGDAGML